jgi:DNA-directed RNA polymerase subunit RPC12/RpoP
MQDKQKVTLYLPPELHRQLKIRAAVDGEPMSSIAQRAIVFYLENPEVVDEMGSHYGQTHRVYSCPECASSVFIKRRAGIFTKSTGYHSRHRTAKRIASGKSEDKFQYRSTRRRRISSLLKPANLQKQKRRISGD